MREVADGVYLLPGFPRHAVNCYLAGDVLVDARTRSDAAEILRALRDRPLSLVALTHAHPDHIGAVDAVCTAREVPLACHAADRGVVEGSEPMRPCNPALKSVAAFFQGPPHAVSRELADGDELGEFRVVHAPGHTPGHLLYFRERDRLLIAGDLLANMHPLTMIPGLHEPPAILSVNPAENRRSMQLLAELKPATALFGHGPPLRDGKALLQFVDRLLG